MRVTARQTHDHHMLVPPCLRVRLQLPVPWAGGPSPASQLPRPKAPKRTDLDAPHAAQAHATPLQPRPPMHEPPTEGTGVWPGRRGRHHGTVFQEASHGAWLGSEAAGDAAGEGQAGQEGEQQEGEGGLVEQEEAEGGEEDREDAEEGGPVFIEQSKLSAQPVIFGNGHLEEQVRVKIGGCRGRICLCWCACCARA